MGAIEEEIIARERVSAGQGRPPPRRGTSEQKPPSTAAALVSGEPSNVQMPCCYCSQLHFPNDCDTITHVDARKQSLRRNGRCFSCLRRGHLGRDCRSTNRCRSCRGLRARASCRGRHHTSICESSPTRTPGTRIQAQPRSQAPSSGTSPVTQTPVTLPSSTAPTTTHLTLNPSAPAFTPSSTSLCAGSNKVVFLQTALAEISNPREPLVCLTRES